MPENRKLLAGIFVAGGFLLFALGLFWIGDRRLLFSDSIELQTGFARLSGLQAGSKVAVGGMDAGEVIAIEVPLRPGEKFRVRFRVLSRFLTILRSDSIASIQVEGLVGSKLLQVEAGSEAAARVEPGATIPSREPVEISQIIQQTTDTLGRVNVAIEDVQKRVGQTIGAMAGLEEEARKTVAETRADIHKLLTSSKTLVDGIDGLVGGIRKGQGLAGKLVTDDSLYERLQAIGKHAESTSANINRTAEHVRKISSDIESRKLGDNLSKTAANLEKTTARLHEIMAEFRPPGGPGERGLLDDVRDSLENTREATSDMAENMEALKRNWFFRGYFNKRGFFDLDAVSLEDYRQGKVAPDRERVRAWIHAKDLFQADRMGREALSGDGLNKLSEAMAPYLRFAPNTVLIVEGYSGKGSEPEQLLHSRDRARLVRRYLIERFGLKSNFTGAIPMGAVASSGPSAEFWEGVSLVFFPERKK